MKQITMNKTDLRVSCVCLGADHFGDKLSEEQAFRILDTFAEYGGSFLDTAAVYGRWMPEGENVSEQIVGRWLKARKAQNTMIVATKGGHYSLRQRDISRVTRQDVESDLHDSLQALGLDAIDFYWLHRDDPAKPIGEIIDMMEDFRKAGLLRWYGASNYTRSRLMEADAYAKGKGITGFSAVSNQWNPARINPGYVYKTDPSLVYFKDDSALELFRETGMSFVPYNSTASGYFAKRHDGNLSEKLEERYRHEANDALYQRLLEQSEERGKSVQTLLLEHIAEDYGTQIIPITSVSKPEQLNPLKNVFA